jgi:ABC-type bacteriocin/lantibiotic exporter with double-glycine peptidase domain
MKTILKDLKEIYASLMQLNVSKKDIAHLLVFTISASLSSLFQPYFVGKIIDSISSNSQRNLFMYFIIIIILFSISILGIFFKNRKSIKIVSNVEMNIKSRIFSEIMESSYGHFRTYNKGKLINIIHEDSMMFSNTLSYLLGMIIDLLGFILSLLIMLFISPTLSLVVVIIFPILLYIYFISGRKLRSLQIDLKHWYDQYMNYMNESFQNFKVIKIFNIEDIRSHGFISVLKKVYNVGVNRVMTETFSEIGIRIALFLSQILVLVLGTILIFSNNLTIGMLVSFNSYSANFKDSTTNLSSLNSTIQSVMVSFNRIFELSNYIDTEELQTNNNGFINSISKITIKDLKFVIDDKVILNNLNAEFVSGEPNQVSGESGSGKTTLFYILSKLESNYSGKIFFNDLNLDEIPNRIFRKKVCFVTQNSELFSTSILDNLTYGYDGNSIEDVVDVCKKLDIHDFISNLPLGYESKLSNYGDNISGGQAQRICIARAILSNADVYIFDEITSALDKINRSKVIDCINELAEKKIVIMSSHQDILTSNEQSVLNLSVK